MIEWLFVAVTATFQLCNGANITYRCKTQNNISVNIHMRVSFDLLIHASQFDVIRHFGSSYCYNDKFI